MTLKLSSVSIYGKKLFLRKKVRPNRVVFFNDDQKIEVDLRNGILVKLDDQPAIHVKKGK